MMGASSDMDAFLASLAPPKERNSVAMADQTPYPNSPGVPIAAFQDRIPESALPIQFDNYATFGVDTSQETPNVVDIFADPQFQPGAAIILKAGNYPGPIVVNHDVSLRADGEVYVQSTGVGLIVQNGAQLVIEGIGFLAGSDLVVEDGKVQIARCSFASTLKIQGDSVVSCRDSIFQNASAWGAVISGKAHGIFVSTAFTGRGVHVDGGDLSMLSCRVENVEEQAVFCQRGLARFDDCSFSETAGNVIQVEGHSDLILSKCAVMDSQGGNLITVGKGALVKVKQSELKGGCRAAIVASNGATVACEDLTFKKPVIVGTSALLRLKGCHALTIFVNSARLNMQDCIIESAPRTAVVGVGSSDLQIENTSFSDCSSNGIEVTSQASATLVRCNFRANRGAGAVIASRSANLRNCVFEGNTIGCQLTGRNTHVSFEQCAFQENLSAGVTILDGCSPAFTSCQFRRNDRYGVVVAGTKASFTTCEFGSNKGVAAIAKDGGQPTFESCVFDSNENFGAEINGRGTLAVFDKCRFQKNQPTSAVLVYQKAQATFLKCGFVESGVFHVELRDDSQGKFEECELSASTGGYGIFVHSESKVELEKCLMKDEPRTSVFEGMETQTDAFRATGLQRDDHLHHVYIFGCQSRSAAMTTA
jgi:hypothetical protein